MSKIHPRRNFGSNFALYIHKDFRDCRQVTFIMLNRFFLYSKKTPLPHSYRSIPRRMEYHPIHLLFILYFKFWRYFFVKQATRSFICCFIVAFTSADIIFHKFLELHSCHQHMKKRFLSWIFLFKQINSTPLPTPLTTKIC